MRPIRNIRDDVRVEPLWVSIVCAIGVFLVMPAVLYMIGIAMGVGP